MNLSSIGRKFFKVRGYMGVPVFLLAVIFADEGRSMPALGLISILIGEIIRIWSVAYSGATTRARQIMAQRLVREGPYSMTRNPIYIGNFLIGLGVVLFSGALFPYLLVAYLILFWMEYIPIIHAEEEYLSSKFGEEFERYKREVPRVFPNFWRFRPPEGYTPDIRMAIRSEKSTFFILSGTLVAIILKFIFL